MFINVESFFLYTGTDTQTMQSLDAEEQDETTNCSPEVDNQYAETLSSEEAPAVSVESTIGG